jgi:hypothetical protein
MERPRPKSTSPTPTASIRKSNSSSSVLDDILRRNGRSASASAGYGLADNYRRPFKVPTTLLKPIRTPTPDQGAAEAANRVRSPLVPKPIALFKSVSAPLNSHDWFLDEAMAASGSAEAISAWENAPSHASESGVAEWKCRGCWRTDPRCLSPNADGEESCLCGVVERGKVVALDRQKNCSREADPTRVGDANDCDPRTAAMNAWANGPETASARRHRETHALGSTRIARTVAMRHGFGNAQGRVETQQRRDNREVIEGDSRDAKKTRAILVMVEQVINQKLTSAHDHVLRHIRQEASRIYQVSVEHCAYCTAGDSCQMSLSDRSNAILGICIVQVILENLCASATDSPSSSKSPNTTMATLNSVAAGVSAIEISKLLDGVKELGLTFMQSVQRLTVSATIGRISRWTDEEVCQPCEAPEPPPPTALCLPRSMVFTPDSKVKGGVNDPNDLAFKLRDRVLMFADQLRVARADVRNQVLLHLWCPEVVDFAINARQPAGSSTAQLSDAQWPVDAVAVAMLLATAHNMGQHEEKSSTAIDTVCAEHKLSPVAFYSFIDEFQPVLKSATVAPELSVALY